MRAKAVKITKCITPSMKPTLKLWGGLSHEEVLPSASARRARRSDGTTSNRTNGSSLFQYQGPDSK